jgi:di- and tripeptidase
LKEKDARPPPALASHPSQRKNRFFDSLGPGGAQTPKPVGADARPRDAVGGQELQIDSQDIYQFAHFGYVHCMLLGKGILPEAPSEEVLVSGGGDGRILLWRINPARGGLISNICALEDGREEGESILSLAREGSFLYSGRFDGEINVWDLETRQLVRSLKANTGDVHTLTLGAGVLFAGGKSGVVHVCYSRLISRTLSLTRPEIQRALRDNVDIQGTQRTDPCICIYNIQRQAHLGDRRQ